MNNGGIERKGTFGELRAMDLDFMKLLKTTDAERRAEEATQDEVVAKSGDTIDSPVETRETVAKGRMSRRVFFAYFKASKRPVMIALMVLIFSLNQAVSGGSDYFIAYWVNIESSSWHGNRTTEFLWRGPLSRDAMVYLYSAMIAVIVLLSQFQTIVYFGVCMWSSVNLHSDMFRSIMRATMYFYNTNPAGRILNRCVTKSIATYNFDPTV